MDNSKDRVLDVFFYGLYMDKQILLDKGVEPKNPRAGIVRDYRLRVGNLATLLRSKGDSAYGMVYSITHDDIYALYEGSGLDAYVSESLLIETEEKETIAALCCNLLIPPSNDEKNDSYKEKLFACMQTYGLQIPTKGV